MVSHRNSEIRLSASNNGYKRYFGRKRSDEDPGKSRFGFAEPVNSWEIFASRGTSALEFPSKVLARLPT